MRKYKVSALDRRVVSYPRPKFYEMIIVLAYEQMTSVSKTCEEMMEDWFNRHPEEVSKIKMKINNDPGIVDRAKQELRLKGK